MFTCSMTGQHFDDYAEGIWDDGEWISWNWINGELHKQELREHFHSSAPVEVIELFNELVETAASYRAITGRYLQIWGELGELYAELKHGIHRHKPMTRGSDGRMGNDFVEVKTISPEKTSSQIHVKRAGNFNKLCVVRINERFEFESRIIDRKTLGKGEGKHAKYAWTEQPPAAQ